MCASARAYLTLPVRIVLVYHILYIIPVDIYTGTGILYDDDLLPLRVI
jgi:hypothetical protein